MLHTTAGALWYEYWTPGVQTAVAAPGMVVYMQVELISEAVDEGVWDAAD